jgi:hypothetical protein
MQAQLPAAQLQSWLQSAPRILARHVVIANVSAVPVTLVHIGVYPNKKEMFMVLDDFGLAARDTNANAKAHANSKPSISCVQLLPGVFSHACFIHPRLHLCKVILSPPGLLWCSFAKVPPCGGGSVCEDGKKFLGHA